MYLGQESDKLANKGAKQLLDAVKGGKSMEDALKEYLASLPKPPKPEHHKEAKDEKKDAKDEKKKDEKKDAKDEKKGDDKKGDAKDEKKGDDKKGDAKDEKKGDDNSHGSKDGNANDDHDSDDAKADETPEDMPSVETSIPFKESGVPFDGASPEVDVTAIAFSLKNPGDVPDDVIPLAQGIGYAIMQLKEIKPASDEDWLKNRDAKIESARLQKQADALTMYIKRLRSAAENDIKPCRNKDDCGNNDLLLDPADKAKADASGSAKPSEPPPGEPQE
jgi:peptidyl-prolyl cis-trans isomerase D